MRCSCHKDVLGLCIEFPRNDSHKAAVVDACSFHKGSGWDETCKSKPEITATSVLLWGAEVLLNLKQIDFDETTEDCRRLM